MLCIDQSELNGWTVPSTKHWTLSFFLLFFLHRIWNIAGCEVVLNWVATVLANSSVYHFSLSFCTAARPRWAVLFIIFAALEPLGDLMRVRNMPSPFLCFYMFLFIFGGFFCCALHALFTATWTGVSLQEEKKNVGVGGSASSLSHWKRLSPCLTSQEVPCSLSDLTGSFRKWKCGALSENQHEGGVLRIKALLLFLWDKIDRRLVHVGNSHYSLHQTCVDCQ